MVSVLDRLRGATARFSVEFFPPRDTEDERILWRAIREMEPLDPAYMSITYGAGGSSRDGTIRSITRVATETTLVPVAHLTAVNHSVAELRNVIGWYAAAGVHNILALRGDPPGDPMGEWTAHPHGLRYAEELVRLVRELGDFCVGVAAFPYSHPRSTDPDSDIDYLVRKFQAGADFAIAQLFFEAEDFLRLRDRVVARGCDKLLVPSVMPLTTPKILAKTIELSGAPAPRRLLERLERHTEDPRGFRCEGVDAVTELCQRLLDEGVPDLHFITFNRSKATREVVARLGLLPVRPP